MLSLFFIIQLSIEGVNKADNSNSRGIVPLDNVNTVHCVCVAFLGRLGNQIFQFASAYGIAKQKGMQVRLSANDKVVKIFNLSDVRVVQNRKHCGHAAIKRERYTSSYDVNLLEFSPKSDVLLLDYLQSWKYFINATDDLRGQLQFKEEILIKAQEIFLYKVKANRFYENNSTYVGLHVRRGDMAAQKKGTRSSWPYNVATRQYIIHAISHFLRHYKYVTFVICSDDIKWVKTKIGKYTDLLNMVFMEKNSPEVDLAILSFCNHTIMTTGTFSWWAAWLAGGDAVYYKDYISNTSSLRKQFSEDFSDYYLPRWIPMV